MKKLNKKPWKFLSKKKLHKKKIERANERARIENKCQKINCNNKNAYFGNNYIEKICDKLEWNLG